MFNLQPILGGHPIFSGYLTISHGWLQLITKEPNYKAKALIVAMGMIYNEGTVLLTIPSSRYTVGV